MRKIARETAGAASTRSSLRPLNKRAEVSCKPRAISAARTRSHIQSSSSALCALAHWGGRSSTPEASVIKSRSRGVLDPRMRGDDDGGLHRHLRVIAKSEAKQSIAPPAKEWISSSPRLAQPLRIVAGKDVERTRQYPRGVHDQSGKPQRIKRRKRARNDRNRTNESLSSQSEHLRATHRQTAVELATCPRQCTVALQSNFCRHMYRTVNTQASVRTFAQTSLADGSLRARSRSASTHDTSP